MQTIVGVKFRSANKTYYFDPMGEKFNIGDGVIVETSKGLEYATISIANEEHDSADIVAPLKAIVRKATPKDDAINQENQQKREYALKVGEEKIAKNKLEMKLVDVEYTFDRSKIIFSFTAEGRVDFRELVRDLASVLKNRIELRQIYERDDIKLRGALAPCGRVCCCHAFLDDFQKVSIKMAKNQSLSLNPQKISGVCGKLMCCLKYENDYYQDVNKRMPKIGSVINTPDGEGRVENTSVLKCKLLCKIESKDDDTFELKEYSLDDIVPDPRYVATNDDDDSSSDDALKDLED